MIDENAKWITAPCLSTGMAFHFRRDFSLKKQIKKATLEVSSVGNYAAYINGNRIGKDVLTPGWT